MYWSIRPNCSDQKYGTGSYTASPPSKLAAATSGACSALSQCSTRSRRRYLRDQNAAQSPTAKTPGSDERSPSSTATPLSSLRPEPSSHATAGRTPTAVTTSSASTRPPPARMSPPPVTSSTAAPSRRSIPAAAYHRSSGKFGADPSGTHDGQPQPRPQQVSQGACVIDRAQEALRAITRQADGHRAGRYHEPVKLVLATVGQQHAIGQANRALTEPQTDTKRREVSIEPGVVDAAGQELLGQWRPVIGWVGLRSDQRHGACVPA